MKTRRVVITGLGVVASTGAGRQAFWSALRSGQSGVRPIHHFDAADFRTRIAATIEPEWVCSAIRPTDAGLYDLTGLIALQSAREAVEDSGLGVFGPAAGICWGTAVGGIRYLDEQFANFYLKGKRWVSPYTVPRVMANNASSLLGVELGIRGPNLTFSTACSSSSHALAYGYQLISRGMLDIALCGGSECPVSPGHLQAWDRLRALSCDNEFPGRACRPFSANRCGLVLGDGAACLVLEEAEKAKDRGAACYGEILGSAANCDAEHLVQPSAESQAECIRAALQDAGFNGRRPDYISAHATGTIDGDRAEVQAVKSVFGQAAYDIPVSSIKGHLGHTLGASGALATASVLLAMKEEIIPPTLNLEVRDPECDLDHVGEGPRPRTVETALIHSFAFGGSNAVLVVGTEKD